jgi:GNAT superfamily N-acetyltransferase
MIRLRLPSMDDLYLYRLIVKRLVPFARKTQPELRIGKQSLIHRLGTGKVFVAAKRGQAPFGFISLKIKQNILFIDLLAVDSTSENKGWGSKLIIAGEKYAKRMNCSIAQVWVDENNAHALTFYANKGYQVLEYMPPIHCFLLRKDL